MDKCVHHDHMESVVEAIEIWKAVDTHRQEQTEKKLEKICREIEKAVTWLTKIESSLPAKYETRSDAEAAHLRLHERIDKLRDETEIKMQTTVKNAIAMAGIAAGTIATVASIIVSLVTR